MLVAMRALSLPVRPILSAAVTTISFFFFTGPLLAYIFESSSARAATCLEATDSTGTFGDGTNLSGLVLLGAAIATIVFARRARAAGEDGVVAWWCLVAAGFAIAAGILVFAVALAMNSNACSGL